MSLNNITEILKNNGYKITPQRKAILEVLLEFKNNLISAEKLFNKCKTIYSKTNLSTVYRNLEILEELNILHKTVTQDGYSLFKLACTDFHHHHIICKECGKTEMIDFCPIENLKSECKNKNFTITEHKIELYGYCKKCNNK